MQTRREACSGMPEGMESRTNVLASRVSSREICAPIEEPNEVAMADDQQLTVVPGGRIGGSFTVIEECHLSEDLAGPEDGKARSPDRPTEGRLILTLPRQHHHHAPAGRSLGENQVFGRMISVRARDSTASRSLSLSWPRR